MQIVDTFLRAALEETGAQRALLILLRSDQPRVAAEAVRRSKKIVVRLRDEVASESLLPASLDKSRNAIRDLSLGYDELQ
jgi:hypothetical protein